MRSLTEAEITSGYASVLGRTPSRQEIQSALSYFGQPHAFQNGLIVSEEFRLRRIHVAQHMRVAPVDLFRTKIVFVHIEKCGGTTLRTMLASQFDTGRTCPEHFNGLADWTANELAAYDLFAGHFDLQACHVVPGRRTATITMLREPKARLLSLYNFWRAHRPHPSFSDRTLVGLAQRNGAVAFFSHPSVARHPNIRDGITGQLTRKLASPIGGDGVAVLQANDPILADATEALQDAWRAVTGLTCFGVVEQFDLSRRLLNQELGLRMESIEPRQVLSSLVSPMLDESRPPPAPISPQLEALLDALTPVDRVLHAAAVALFEERASALDGKVPPAGGGGR